MRSNRFKINIPNINQPGQTMGLRDTMGSCFFKSMICSMLRIPSYLGSNQHDCFPLGSRAHLWLTILHCTNGIGFLKAVHSHSLYTKYPVDYHHVVSQHLFPQFEFLQCYLIYAYTVCSFGTDFVCRTF